MKKEYIKPRLSLERFSFTQNITLGCAGVSHEGNAWGRHNFYSPSTCAWITETVPGLVESLWLESTNACVVKLESKDSYNGLCYNQPEGNIAVFGS